MPCKKVSWSSRSSKAPHPENQALLGAPLEVPAVMLHLVILDPRVKNVEDDA